jgi:hypothetical protein
MLYSRLPAWSESALIQDKWLKKMEQEQPGSAGQPKPAAANGFVEIQI